MNAKTFAAFLLPLAVASQFVTSDASACGGCFVPPEENTQVTGHRMILSVSKDQSTLYDQIQYSGDPESFAWVLPIKGQVQLGVSSDLLFNQLGNDTRVQVLQPPLNCAPVYDCYGSSAYSSASAGGGFGQDGGVSVIAQEQVGPYETVQLSASDPGALDTWLDTHGYNVPDEIQPIVASYVTEGFDFLAMKLIPGVGTDRMAPVRITTPGGSPSLPLRMVAAGTGATTAMTLWVVAEGRYEPSNFPSFTIPAEGVIWDWDTSSSNYDFLRGQAYSASDNHGWLVEASLNVDTDDLRFNITNVAEVLPPDQSGYGVETSWDEAVAEANADIDALFAGMNPADVRVTRLRAELSRPALANDLQLEASLDQTLVQNIIQTTKTTGEKPVCPEQPDCGSMGSGMGDGPGWGAPWAGSGEGSSSGGGCAVGDGSSSDALFGLGMLGLLFGASRRRRRR